MLGLLAALIVFGRRAQHAAYAQIEGQPGRRRRRAAGCCAAAGRPSPRSAFTKQQDVVHRVVGPPGIVLVGEGNPNRLRPLLATERRKHERVAAETPIHEVDRRQRRGPGAAAQAGRVTSPSSAARSSRPSMTDVLNRLKALDASRPDHPAAQGPGADQHEGHARQHARPLTTAIAIASSRRNCSSPE